jgi:hypothetical protein
MELGLLRFNGFDTLYPELVTADGKRVHRWKEQEKSMRNRQAQESDFPIVEQGKSVTIPLQADLFWPNLAKSTLTFRWWLSSGEAGKYFDDLKPGNYKLRLVYQNQHNNLEVELPSSQILNDNVWKGQITTPYASILLRDSVKDQTQ